MAETIIGTDAIKNVYGGDESLRTSRKPEIMADAAHANLTAGNRALTGQTLLDDDVLSSKGITDFSAHSYDEGGSDDDLELDLYVD